MCSRKARTKEATVRHGVLLGKFKTWVQRIAQGTPNKDRKLAIIVESSRSHRHPYTGWFDDACKSRDLSGSDGDITFGFFPTKNKEVARFVILRGQVPLDQGTLRVLWR